MQSAPLGLSRSPTNSPSPSSSSSSSSSPTRRISRTGTRTTHHYHAFPSSSSCSCSNSLTFRDRRSSFYPFTPLSRPAGICHASQAVELFPSISPEIVVRDARLEDCWEVADTHCSSFFPEYTFPLDLVLRIDRYMALLSGFSVPPGCMRTCLVAAVAGSAPANAAASSLCIECGDLGVEGFDGKIGFNRRCIAGILTVDTVADFLPRRGPFKQRRTGIAYVANVAVRKEERRKGIAKNLIAEAEERARSWGCRSVALHCDANNLAAMRLYKSQGYKCIRVPENAQWPEPKTSRGVQYKFMMKLLAKK